MVEVLEFEVIEVERVAEMRQHLQRLFSGHGADVSRNLPHLRRLDALLDDAVDIKGLDRVVHLRHVEVVAADAREELVRLRDHSGVADDVFALSVAEPEQGFTIFLHLANAGDVGPGAIRRVSIATGQEGPKLKSELRLRDSCRVSRSIGSAAGGVVMAGGFDCGAVAVVWAASSARGEFDERGAIRGASGRAASCNGTSAATARATTAMATTRDRADRGETSCSMSILRFRLTNDHAAPAAVRLACGCETPSVSERAAVPCGEAARVRMTAASHAASRATAYSRAARCTRG